MAAASSKPLPEILSILEGAGAGLRERRARKRPARRPEGIHEEGNV